MATANGHSTFRRAVVSNGVLSTTLVVQVERYISVVRKCESVCRPVRIITLQRNGFWPRYFTCSIILTPPRSFSQVKVTGKCSKSQEDNVSFSAMHGCTLWADVYNLNRQSAAPNGHTTLLWLIVCGVLCAKVVGATSSEGFLICYKHAYVLFIHPQISIFAVMYYIVSIIIRHSVDSWNHYL